MNVFLSKRFSVMDVSAKSVTALTQDRNEALVIKEDPQAEAHYQRSEDLQREREKNQAPNLTRE